MTNKYLISFLLAFGLFVGSANAAIIDITPSEVLTIGDGLEPTGSPSVEIDEYATGGQVATPALIAIDDWVGLDVIKNGVFSLVSSAGAVGSGSSEDLSFDIWTATAGSPWTYNDALPKYGFATASSLTTTLLQGEYLVHIFGELDATALTGNQLYSYTLEITSAVPVPAAVWLFGSALVGLFGFQRRKRMTDAA